METLRAVVVICLAILLACTVVWIVSSEIYHNEMASDVGIVLNRLQELAILIRKENGKHVN